MTDITVLLTVWKRPYLERQLAALAAQTLPPAALWIYHCAHHVDPQPAIRSVAGMSVNYIHSDEDLGYFGRFAIAPFVETKYVTVIDDDLLPGPEWLAHARTTSARHAAVVCTAGVRFPRHCHDVRVGHSIGNLGHCPTDTWVDFGCNSWLFETEWARRFWTIPPVHLRNAEDMHFAAAMSTGGVGTLVAAQTDPSRSGNGAPEMGSDVAASFRRIGYDDERNATFAYLRLNGWRSIADRQESQTGIAASPTRMA